MVAKKIFDVQVLSTTLMGIVKTTLENMCKLSFSQEPVMEVKNIIEYKGRMRISGMEKFNGPTYVSAINFYLNQADQDKNRACGIFVSYLESENAPKILRGMGYDFDEDDDESIKDCFGEFCNVIAGSFKNEISNLDYLELLMSAPSKYINSVPDGMAFSYDQYEKVEVSFFYWNKKIIVAEVSLTDLPMKSKS